MTAEMHVLMAGAEVVLRRRFQTALSLGEPVLVKDQTRSLVLRCPVYGPAGAVAPMNSVIVKYIRDDAARGFTDWASLAFLSALPGADDLVPRFLGGDVTGRLFVIADLGGSQSLEELLTKGNAGTVKPVLQAMAITMGRLQAATFDREGSFDVLRHSLPEAHMVGRRREAERWLRDRVQMHRWIQAVGCALPYGFDHCLEQMAHVYTEPGPFLCFTHGDPAPSNNHLSEGRVRLLDFEYGGFRHALYDLTGWNVLCPLPAEYVKEMCRSFRHELATACPEIRDDGRFAYAWAAMCAFRALAILTWIKPDIIGTNRPWVDEGWTSRHAVLAAVLRLCEATEGVAEFGPVNDVSARLSVALRQRWPAFAGMDEITPPWPALVKP